MTESDKEKFMQAMTILAEVNSKSISAVLLLQYYADLSDLTIETVLSAIHKARLILKFFPKISELRELAILSTVKLLPDEAWSEVKRQILDTCGTGNQPVYSNPKIEAAVNSIGGLNTIWQAGIEQESYYRHNFIEAYKSITTRDEKDLLIGAPTKAEAKQILNKLSKKITEKEGVKRNSHPNEKAIE